MKKLIISLSIIALCLISVNTNAQDLITKKDGTDINAKVLELTLTDVKYKRSDNLNGPTYILPKSDVLMIRYENGTKDIINETVSNDINNSNEEDINKLIDKDMCELGRQDADMHYPVKQTGALMTMAATIVTSPVLGLIPTFVCRSKVPKDINLKYNDEELMKDFDYNKCYKEQAHKKKKKKLLTFYGIGAGIWAAGIATSLMIIFIDN